MTVTLSALLPGLSTAGIFLSALFFSHDIKLTAKTRLAFVKTQPIYTLLYINLCQCD